MKLRLNLLIAASAAALLVGCSDVRSQIIGGMPGSGYQGANLSPQVLDMMNGGDTTVYEVGPDGIHNPPANQNAR